MLHTHTIHQVSHEQRHLAWDKSLPPVLSVKGGEEVFFRALDASGGAITPATQAGDLKAIDFAVMDPVHGPVFVEGASPGDTLQVDIVEVKPAAWGWTAIFPGFGLLAEEFDTAALKIWEFEAGSARFSERIVIPLDPFCGEMGVAPRAEGSFSTIPPGFHGGNIDTRHLTAGSTLFLPVGTEGALFSLGDGHAAQGDGEVCGTAIETPMDVTARLSVRKDITISEFEFLTPGSLAPRTNTAPYYVTTGHGPDLMEAARKAIRHMIAYLQRTHDLTPLPSSVV